MLKLKHRSFLVLICVVLLFSSIAVSPSVNAFNYPKIKLGKEVKGKLEDYFGDVSYELNLFSQKKVKIVYSSTTATDFCLYDGKLNKIFESNQTKKVEKTVTLKKGNYVFGIYNSTYENGEYSLLVKDDTVYAKSIYFEKDEYTLSCGETVKPLLLKKPENSVVKNIKFTSSNERVATVNKSGKITATGLGKAVITAKSGKNVKAECTVTVNYQTVDIFNKTSKNLPKINGHSAVYSSADTSVVKLKNKLFIGVTQGITQLTSYVDYEKYTVEVQVVARKKLVKKAKSKLKNSIENPKELVILHIYRGYNNRGKACVVLDYGIKRGALITDRKYFICNYTEKYLLKSKTSAKLPKLTKFKEI